VVDSSQNGRLAAVSDFCYNALNMGNRNPTTRAECSGAIWGLFVK